MRPRLEDMTDELQEKYLVFADKMTAEKIPFSLTCVIRSHAEQEAFYAQGREPLADVNAKRLAAGMTAIAERDNYIVTHTKNSRHFPGPDGKSRAFDIVILKNGRTPTWDVKWDADKDSVPDYLESARIGKSVGLVAGGLDFGKFHDWPHYEVAG